MKLLLWQLFNKTLYSKIVFLATRRVMFKYMHYCTNL